MRTPTDSAADGLRLAALAVAMIATRMDHFGGALALPDASLAVFFLGGLWLRSSWAFAALCAVAFGVDVVALAQQGLGAECLSPAYPFMAAAYGCLWAAGRRCGTAQTIPAGRGLGLLVLGAAGSLAISNLSWFAFSGRVVDVGVLEFSASTLRHAPRYIGWAVGYSLLGLAAGRLLQRVRWQAGWGTA